jgi:hypothetical protein
MSRLILWLYLATLFKLKRLYTLIIITWELTLLGSKRFKQWLQSHIEIFWVMTMCSLASGYWRYTETQCLHFVTRSWRTICVTANTVLWKIWNFNGGHYTTVSCNVMSCSLVPSYQHFKWTHPSEDSGSSILPGARNLWSDYTVLHTRNKYQKLKVIYS